MVTNSLFYLFATLSRLLTTLKKKALENAVGKGENAGGQHFLLFPQCFLLYKAKKTFLLPNFNLSSANAFKILSLGEGLNAYVIGTDFCRIYDLSTIIKSFISDRYNFCRARLQ